jgi:hypothetical protein
MSEIFLRYVVWGNENETTMVQIQPDDDIHILKQNIKHDLLLNVRTQDIQLVAVALPLDQLQGVPRFQAPENSLIRSR